VQRQGVEPFCKGLLQFRRPRAAGRKSLWRHGPVCRALAADLGQACGCHRSRRSGGELHVFGASLRIRKRIEESFGWIKTVAGQRKTRFRGLDRVGWAFAFSAAAYNLVRLLKLLAETG
jgi:hypothetical protein